MEIEQKHTSFEKEHSYKKSYFAYVVLWGVLTPMLAIPFLIANSKDQLSSSVGIAILILLLTLGITTTIRIKTFVAFYNDDGVYIISGIFPWTRGVSGTRWKDISEASYKTGLISWLIKSYNIRLGHRFTKTSEMELHNIKNGHILVGIINEKINELTKENL